MKIYTYECLAFNMCMYGLNKCCAVLCYALIDPSYLFPTLVSMNHARTEQFAREYHDQSK